MNEKQMATLAKLLGWEVDQADSSYLRTGCILPDGRFVETTSGPPTEVVTQPEGTVLVGVSAE